MRNISTTNIHFGYEEKEAISAGDKAVNMFN